MREDEDKNKKNDREKGGQTEGINNEKILSLLVLRGKVLFAYPLQKIIRAKAKALSETHGSHMANHTKKKKNKINCVFH